MQLWSPTQSGLDCSSCRCSCSSWGWPRALRVLTPGRSCTKGPANLRIPAENPSKYLIQLHFGTLASTTHNLSYNNSSPMCSLWHYLVHTDCNDTQESNIILLKPRKNLKAGDLHEDLRAEVLLGPVVQTLSSEKVSAWDTKQSITKRMREKSFLTLHILLKNSNPSLLHLCLKWPPSPQKSLSRYQTSLFKGMPLATMFCDKESPQSITLEIQQFHIDYPFITAFHINYFSPAVCNSLLIRD